MRKLLETKLYNRNLIKELNTSAVPLVRYSRSFLKWIREEPQQMNQRTRKLVMMHKALHPKDDIDRLYVSRKEGGRGLSSSGDSINASIRQLEDGIKKRKERRITVARNNTNNTRINRTTTTRKQKWEEKQLYGHFKWQTSKISHEKTWTWLRKGNLKRETKSLFIAAQNNTIRTNYVKANIDKTKQNSKCRLFGDRRKNGVN